MQTIQASYIFHRNEKRIKLQFQNYVLLNKLIKSIPGARWSKTHKSWHIPCNNKLYNDFKKNLPEGWLVTEVKETPSAIPLQTKTPPPTVKKNTAVKAICVNTKPVAGNKIYPTALSPKNQQALQQYLQCLQLKAYSASTIKTYTSEFAIFLQALGKTEAPCLSTQRVKDYLQYCHTSVMLIIKRRFERELSPINFEFQLFYTDNSRLT